MSTTEAPAKAERWTAQWKELYEEVINTGLCTGCAGCVVTCPHDVIGYEHEEGKYKPFHLEEELGQLHPRREGLHHLHPGLPAVPQVGDQRERAPLRAPAPG
ncbi:MAG: 4Fe-4S binding protein [Actinomycetes bacterium]